ncbi:MAG: hypothetical protein ACK4UJ_07885 [Leptonema sp. (in: bacteria)]
MYLSNSSKKETKTEDSITTSTKKNEDSVQLHSNLDDTQLEQKQKKEALSENIEEPKKEVASKFSEKKEAKDKERKIFQKTSLELFITGYLYYDSTGNTFILLEKKEKAPSEVLSHLIRKGNATLEWSENKFVISYAESQIFLDLKELQEIRFIEDCAIFIPVQKKPYYYFFSKQNRELKKFMSDLTLMYKSSI